MGHEKRPVTAHEKNRAAVACLQTQLLGQRQPLHLRKWFGRIFAPSAAEKSARLGLNRLELRLIATPQSNHRHGSRNSVRHAAVAAGNLEAA